MVSATPCLLQSLVVSLLLLLVFTLVFSRTAGVLTRLNSLTHRFLWFPLKNFCFLGMLAVPSFVFAATETVFCKALVFLELAELRVLHATPAAIQPSIPLISLCTIQLRTLCAARFLATLCLYATSRPSSGEMPGF